MTKEEYLEEKEKIDKNCQTLKIELLKKYVSSNNQYKKGDIITDYIGSIIIEIFGYSYGLNNINPCATYTGIEINKNGNPNKKGNRRTIYQPNIKQ
jgi:hypothetical protein